MERIDTDYKRENLKNVGSSCANRDVVPLNADEKFESAGKHQSAT